MKFKSEFLIRQYGFRYVWEIFQIFKLSLSLTLNVGGGGNGQGFCLEKRGLDCRILTNIVLALTAVDFGIDFKLNHTTTRPVTKFANVVDGVSKIKIMS